MVKQHNFAGLFEKFILQTKSGKRLNKNGTRIKKQSINNYTYCFKLLQAFESARKLPIILYEKKGQNKRDHNFLKKYWQNLFRDFTSFLYREKKCHANYVGQNIKMIRTFFNWVNDVCGINTGVFYKSFFVCKEEIDILTLSVARLKFLLFDKEFEKSLSKPLQQCKDVFALGCLVGLRYSDLCRIQKHNIENKDECAYLKMRSMKTNTDTFVKLPQPAIDILAKYKTRKTNILPTRSLFRFNVNIKSLGEAARWDEPVMYHPSRNVSRVDKASTGGVRKFYEAMSSHTMRRTSITLMLTSGMPEYIVRKISGHTNDSKAFYRYVNLAQNLIDKEIDKMHNNFLVVGGISS